MDKQDLTKKAKSKPLTAAAAALLVISVTGAAVTTIVSEETTGSATFQKGVIYNTTGGSNNVQVSSDTSFTADLSTGGTFTTEHVKRNVANDETGALVEYYVLYKDGEDLQKENLENVSFTYETTEDSSWKPGIGPFTDYISRYSDGSIRKDVGSYLHIGEADIRGDSSQDVVICIGDNPGQANEYVSDGVESGDGDIDEGVNFEPGEEWRVSYKVDSQNTFPDSTVSVSAGMASLFNPETGSLSPVAEACPQFQ